MACMMLIHADIYYVKTVKNKFIMEVLKELQFARATSGDRESGKKEYLKLFVLAVNSDCECGFKLCNSAKGFPRGDGNIGEVNKKPSTIQALGPMDMQQTSCVASSRNLSYVLFWEMEKPTRPPSTCSTKWFCKCSKDWTAAHHVNSLMNMWECFRSFCYQQVKQLANTAMAG